MNLPYHFFPDYATTFKSCEEEMELFVPCYREKHERSFLDIIKHIRSLADSIIFYKKITVWKANSNIPILPLCSEINEKCMHLSLITDNQVNWTLHMI